MNSAAAQPSVRKLTKNQKRAARRFRARERRRAEAEKKASLTRLTAQAYAVQNTYLEAVSIAKETIEEVGGSWDIFTPEEKNQIIMEVYNELRRA